ncbi:Crp/Fnr family transcriptional regulator [Tabrizicola sp. J26]|uniref:Crp/Fnr family transcriptional regulator n=1 Tax=Alitabrizicola rongguiensis TaxID=2909234 RepID=UPI001F3D661E|nr:Crp/Fnr family transcriptional regulator [Tabrizicola rongguiensis]MCF1710996.1 Crp/Fnr family transcriptional regulator [Tabrizicola rongguiensis]
MIDRGDAERRIARSGWLADQSEDLRRAVLKVSRLIHYPAGEFVFHAGDSAGGLYGVVKGGVGIYLPSEAGETVLAHVARCGVWFGYGPLTREQERTLSFSLVEPSLLIHVPLAHAQEIGARSPAHQRAILSVTEYGMDIAVRVIETLLIRRPDRRIAATLLRIAPFDEGDPCAALLRLTQAQLGEMANADRQVVNRVLKRFEALGWLRVAYGQIEILDATALRSFATKR